MQVTLELTQKFKKDFQSFVNRVLNQPFIQRYAWSPDTGPPLELVNGVHGVCVVCICKCMFSESYLWSQTHAARVLNWQGPWNVAADLLWDCNLTNMILIFLLDTVLSNTIMCLRPNSKAKALRASRHMPRWCLHDHTIARNYEPALHSLRAWNSLSCTLNFVPWVKRLCH